MAKSYKCPLCNKYFGERVWENNKYTSDDRYQTVYICPNCHNELLPRELLTKPKRGNNEIS